jgi:hypothetical protein
VGCPLQGCPWWVNGSSYQNCSFLASEVSDHTLAEIGDMMGVSRERVRQIENIAIKKLKSRLELRDISNEFVHQQSMVERNCTHTATDSEHLREDEGNLICYFGLGEMGIAEW